MTIELDPGIFTPQEMVDLINEAHFRGEPLLHLLRRGEHYRNVPCGLLRDAKVRNGKVFAEVDSCS